MWIFIILAVLYWCYIQDEKELKKKVDSESSSYVPRSSSSQYAYVKGGDDNCSHSYRYSHKGVDGCSIQRCSKCGSQRKLN